MSVQRKIGFFTEKINGEMPDVRAKGRRASLFANALARGRASIGAQPNRKSTIGGFVSRFQYRPKGAAAVDNQPPKCQTSMTAVASPSSVPLPTASLGSAAPLTAHEEASLHDGTTKVPGNTTDRDELQSKDAEEHSSGRHSNSHYDLADRRSDRQRRSQERRSRQGSHRESKTIERKASKLRMHIEKKGSIEALVASGSTSTGGEAVGEEMFLIESEVLQIEDEVHHLEDELHQFGDEVHHAEEAAEAAEVAAEHAEEVAASAVAVSMKADRTAELAQKAINTLKSSTQGMREQIAAMDGALRQLTEEHKALAKAHEQLNAAHLSMVDELRELRKSRRSWLFSFSAMGTPQASSASGAKRGRSAKLGHMEA